VRWRYKTEGEIISSPAIAPDGTVYVGSADYYLYAIGSTGTLIWRLATGGFVAASPAIADDGTVYIGSQDGSVYAVSPDRLLLWAYRTRGTITTSVALGSDGTVYFTSEDGHLYALTPKGELEWRVSSPEGCLFTSPAIASDGTVLVGATDGSVYAFYPDGKLRWRCPTSGEIRSPPAIGPGDMVFFGTLEGYVYAVDRNGLVTWRYKTGGPVRSSAAVGVDGTVYIGSTDGYLYAILPDGRLKWKCHIGAEVFSTPAVGKSGFVYVGAQDGCLYAIDQSGIVRWRGKTGAGIWSSPAIGTDGTLYVGSQDGVLYAFLTESEGLADTPWPMWRGNVRHTANVSHQIHENAAPSAFFTWEILFPEGKRLLAVPHTTYRIRFDASPSKDPDGKITKYEWDWESDGKYDFTTTDPVAEHRFLREGSYKVTLRVTDDRGATATTSQVVTVSENEPPVASFTWEAVSPEGARILVKPRTCDFVRFDASSSHDPDGRVIKYEWDWESDGRFDLITAEPVVEHRFSTVGSYKVTLRVTDDNGATDTATQIIKIEERKSPVADFTFSPGKPTVRDVVKFTDRSHDPDGKIVAWHWDFGDGDTSTERNPTHRYAEKKTFTVKLTVTGDDGLSATVEKEIEVVNLPPEASFSFEPEEPYAGQEVSFDGSSSRDEDGRITRYSWDFGDGEKAEGVTTTHVFAEEGTYTVRLTVTDDDGATATFEETIKVKQLQEPVRPKEVWGLIIGISDYEEEGLDLGCARADAEALRDVLLSVGVPKEHLLVLLDNAASLISVREGLLWLMKNAGEEDLVIFYFSGHGYQGMDLKPNDERDGLDEYFVVHDTNRSTIEATALRDDEFGQFLDGIRSKHVLVFFDSCYSGGLPRGQRGLPRGGSPKGPLDFFNDFDPEGKLVLAASAENQLSWEDPKLGHGVFTYFLIEGLKGEADLDGDYKVTVKELSAYLKEKVPKYVEKNFGVEQEPQLIGKGTALVEIAKRNRPPTANFTYWPEVPFPGKEVQFQDTSTDDGTITAWSWDFGDGATSTDQHPTHAYAEPGTYTVTLTVTDDGGLSSGTEAEVLIGPPGLVTTVAEAQGLVIISLGSRNGVDVGDRFEVVRPYKISEGTVIEERRAIIEVIAVLGPDRSVCKVLQLFFPVAVKDLVQPIGNPLH